MKAAVYEGPQVLSVRDVPDPKPEPGGVLLRVRACSICGTDLRIYSHGDAKIAPPMIIGHELAGDVVEVSEGTSGFKVGDRVLVAPPGISCGECPMCRKGWGNLCLNRRIIGYHYAGGFAEYIAVPSEAVSQGLLIPIPAGMPYAHAAVTEPLGCVVNGQTPLRIDNGDTVVVIGAGAIGLMHAQLARAKGATKVVVVDVVPLRLKMAERFAFDHIIDGSTTDPVQEVLRLTGGIGSDVTIVAASAGKAQEQAVAMVGKRGRVSLFAGLPKDRPHITLDSNRVHYYELAIYGASASAPDNSREALKWLETGAINANEIVTHRFPLAELVPAMEMMRRGESLKIVIEP